MNGKTTYNGYSLSTKTGTETYTILILFVPCSMTPGKGFIIFSFNNYLNDFDQDYQDVIAQAQQHYYYGMHFVLRFRSSVWTGCEVS